MADTETLGHTPSRVDDAQSRIIDWTVWLAVILIVALLVEGFFIGGSGLASTGVMADPNFAA